MTETRDSAVTAAELDELQKRARHWSWDGHPNVQALLTELADANAALRRERDEALMQASGDKIILARALDQAGADAEHDEKVIEALRASNAKKDAALRKIAGLDYKNAATNMAAYKAVQIATDALTPASQEADHVADAGKMVPASPSPGLRETVIEEETYPEGLTKRDHIAHDLWAGRFPQQSTIAVFLAERAEALGKEKQ